MDSTTRAAGEVTSTVKDYASALGWDGEKRSGYPRVVHRGPADPEIASQVSCGIVAGFIGTRVNGQDSATISPLKPLSNTLFRLTSRTENARWILDPCSKIGNFKRAPVNRLLLPRLRVHGESERDKDDR
jgi:hypothetical protein